MAAVASTAAVAGKTAAAVPPPVAAAGLRGQIVASAVTTAGDSAVQLQRVLDQVAQNPNATPAELVASGAIPQHVVARQVSMVNCLGALGKLWGAFLVAVVLLPVLAVFLITKQKIQLYVYVLFVPSLIILGYCAWKQTATFPIKEVAVRYGFGFSVMFSLVFVAALLCLVLGGLMYAVVLANFGELDAEIVCSVVFTVCLAITEESMKLVQTINFFPYGAMRSPAAYVLVNVVVTCGFATAHSIVVCMAVMGIVGRFHPMSDRHVYAMVTISTVFSIPFHLLTTYLNTMFAARRLHLGHVVNKFCFLILPVFLRSVFTFSLYFLPFAFGINDIRRYLALVVGTVPIVYLFIAYVKLYERRHMPREYLLEAGYLTCCGGRCCAGLPASTTETSGVNGDTTQLQAVV